MSDHIDTPTPQPDIAQTGHFTSPYPEKLRSLLRAPDSLDALDIPVSIITDLILRILFNEGQVSLRRFAEVIRLELKVLDELLEKMQYDKLVDVASAGNVGRYTYVYALTDEGTSRARDALERGQYIGPAPIPIEKYNRMIRAQTDKRLQLTPKQVQRALSHLVLPDDFHRRIGPAINAGTSIFLYGPPGNGKTTVAQAVAELIAGTKPIWVPYALTIGGYIISVYDPLVFEEVPLDKKKSKTWRLDAASEIDRRWGYFKRPAVIVGGELTMDALELRFDPIAKFYEAPLQLKANGGMFLIDDFGRQMMAPAELLNRWIVPLESGVDYLRLRTGQTIQMPFRQLIVFSTNLDPNELVDDAFLRRIQMKVAVESPDERMFFQIFAAMAQQLGVPPDKDGFVYLLQTWYRDQQRALQSVHPRDILKIIVAMAEYEGKPPRLTPDAIDAACRSYFVDSRKAKPRPSTRRANAQEGAHQSGKSGIQRLSR